jgi:hypothetical protein
MMGETTFKLANLNRGEPLPSLFEVPAGYSIKEGPEPEVRTFQRRADKQ